jgi:endonuclease-3
MKGLLRDGVSIKKISELSLSEIQEKISGINFNKNKAIFIHSAADRIINKHNGEVPKTLEQLTAFKGVGPKVAHLILQIAFGETSGVAVDTHVHRISNRLGFVEYTNNPTKTM